MLLLVLSAAARIVDLTKENFFFDEAWVANLALGPIETIWEHKINEAPLGYVLFFHALGRLVGHSDFMFRLPSALSGIVGTFLTYRLSLQFNRSVGIALLAGSFFAFSPLTIYYAHEFKPYASDACFALALYLVTEVCVKRNLLARDLSILCVVGLVSFLFSTPTVLYMPAIIFRLALAARTSKEARIRIAFLSAALFTGFLCIFFFCCNGPSTSLVIYWKRQFPVSSRPLEQIAFFFRSLFSLFRFAFHHRWYGLRFSKYFEIAFIALTIFGLLSAGFRAQRRPLLMYATVPILVAFAAAVVHVYPFGGVRMDLYLYPPLFILWAISIGDFVDWVIKDTKKRVSALLLISLLPPALAFARNRASFSLLDEQVGTMLRRFRNERLSDDRLYCAPIREQYNFYIPEQLSHVTFAQIDYAGAQDQFLNTINDSAGHRLWIILRGFKKDEETMRWLAVTAEKRCKLLDSEFRSNARLYLLMCPEAHTDN